MTEAMCGCLLHQSYNHAHGVGNMNFGPPMNRDGTLLQTEMSTPMTNAQPPFLLRYSPRLFAEEAPEMFTYDEKTNGLRLRDYKNPPWIRETCKTGVKPDENNTWCYCPECRDRYCPGRGERSKAFVPYPKLATGRRVGMICIGPV